MERINFLIVDTIHEIKAMIVDSLANVEYIQLVGEVQTAGDALAIIAKSKVEVVLIGAELDEDGYKAAGLILQEYPNLAVIICDETVTEDTLHRALLAGAKDVLVYPFTPARLVESICRSHEITRRKLAAGQEAGSRGRPRAAAGKVMTVFSTKGGVGKTFVATNMAIALHKKTHLKVMLIDLDLDYGNAALALNILPRSAISDLVNDIHSLDAELIENYLLTHESGIRFLPANVQPQVQDYIRADHVEVIIKTLQQTYDYIVVDMPSHFHPPCSPALLLADKLFVVTTPDVSTVRNVMASLKVLYEANYPKTKVNIILNRVDKRGQIQRKDVEKTMNQPVFGLIPADYRTVAKSLNQGIPVTQNQSRRGLGKNFMVLAAKITR